MYPGVPVVPLVFQGVAVCCRVLHGVAGLVQCVQIYLQYGMRCSVLQRVALCYLQYAAPSARARAHVRLKVEAGWG